MRARRGGTARLELVRTICCFMLVCALTLHDSNDAPRRTASHAVERDGDDGADHEARTVWSPATTSPMLLRMATRNGGTAWRATTAIGTPRATPRTATWAATNTFLLSNATEGESDRGTDNVSNCVETPTTTALRAPRRAVATLTRSGRCSRRPGPRYGLSDALEGAVGGASDGARASVPGPRLVPRWQRDAGEGAGDCDSDGVADCLGHDSDDGDGLGDAGEGAADTDPDSVDNFRDRDMHGDGLLDSAADTNSLLDRSEGAVETNSGSVC
jgi:hypothetical protein